jgi:hypothetical protein
MLRHAAADSNTTSAAAGALSEFLNAYRQYIEVGGTLGLAIVRFLSAAGAPQTLLVLMSVALT